MVSRPKRLTPFIANNVLADPDKSNPTRNRWERPLDTIRSFEAAIDGGYRRKSYMKPEVDPVANWNRRSVFPRKPPHARDSIANTDILAASGPEQNWRMDNRPGSYYGGQIRPNRPDGRGTHTARSSMYGDPRAHNNDGHLDHGPGSNRQRMSRMHTEPMYGPPGGHGGYNLAHKDRSYETVASAAEGSRNSDQIGYQTDPTSSDNSSIERRSPAKRQGPTNDYGIGFNQSQPHNNLSSGLHNPNQPPPPPPHGAAQRGPRQVVTRKEAPTLLKRQSTQQAQQSPQASPAPEKRKSWLMRRFSKKE